MRFGPSYVSPQWIGLAASLMVVASVNAQTAVVPVTVPAGAAASTVAAADAVSRDADGRLLVRAQRLPERLVIDGQLDESFYEQVRPATNFVQAEPDYNQPATEQTEIWIFFDDRNVYVGIRCWDSRPDLWMGLDKRRDTFSFGQNEHVTVGFDTFNDKRNGLAFGVNPAGGIFDTAMTNERDSNRDWNTVWDSRTATFDGGWSVEMAIPFESLRYTPGEQVWGVNVRRNVKWKNEISYLSPVPQGPRAIAGLQRYSSAATLVGLVSPPPKPLFELKPYGITTLDTNRAANISNDLSADFGFDAKYGLTKSLTADFTYNTDFAQVENDEQQVNLTRFSLFFPEKRDFFLEGQGIFNFGGLAQRRTSNPGDVPLPFFSRRIGLNEDGQAIPILAGGRVTGRAGPYSLGLVNIQTREDSTTGELPTNFTVVRARRDILRRSNIGAIFVNRSAFGTLDRANQTYGVDGVFTFYENLNVNTFATRTQTPGLVGDDTSYRGQLEYNGDRVGLVLERMAVGKNFNPEAGYVRRHDFLRHFADLRLSHRPPGSRTIRRFDFGGSFDHFARGTGELDTQQTIGSFLVEFQNSDRLTFQATDSLESLIEPFEVLDGVEIPIGSYRFATASAEYELGTQHRVAGAVSYEFGGFYDGTKKTLNYAFGRITVSSDFSIEPGLSMNWIDLPQGSFVAKVANSRFVYTFSPRTFVSALVQYNSDDSALGINLRLRWEYSPGSDLFVVYNDGRNTLQPGFPALEHRSVVVKITRFFRI